MGYACVRVHISPSQIQRPDRAKANYSRTTEEGPGPHNRGNETDLAMGGATIGAGRDMSPPPLLRDVPRRGYNPIYVVHLRGTTAGR